MTTLTFAAKRLLLTTAGPTAIDDTTITMTFQGDLSTLTYATSDIASAAILPMIRFDQSPYSVTVGLGSLASNATTHLGSNIWQEDGKTFVTDALWIATPWQGAIATYWVDLAGPATPLLSSIEAAMTWNPDAQAYVPLTRIEAGQNFLNAGYQDPDNSLGALSVTENDVFNGSELADEIAGGSGEDRVSGGLGDDRIDGGADADKLWGDFGDDTIYGGGGDDMVDGGVGDDTLYGQAGNDRIKGNFGNDTLFGGDGDDYLTGGGSADTLDGGDGDDTLAGSSGADQLLGGAGSDMLRGGSGADILDGGSGNDELLGNRGADQLSGGDGDDKLNGGLNDDRLIGGNGADILEGGNGMDTLIGGDGGDRLYGGSGADVFVFLGSDQETGFDRIKDWEDGRDMIDLTAFHFTSFEEVQAIAKNQNGHTKLTFADGADGSTHAVVIENLLFDDFQSSDVLL